MNYHILIDDKFIDDFISDAKKVSENNTFIFVFEPNTRFVKSKEGIFAPYYSTQLDNIITQITEYDKVFIHWYHKEVELILKKIPQKTKRYLVFWGGDFYSVPYEIGLNNPISKWLYDPITYKYEKVRHKKIVLEQFWQEVKLRVLRKNIYKGILHLYKTVKIIIQNRSQKKYDSIIQTRRQFLNSLDYVCVWNIHDINKLNQLYSTNVKQINFIYSVGNNFEFNPPISNHHTTNIWIGNSDTSTNNHLDIFEKLKKFKNENIKIYCPLNYGNIEYANFINQNGKSIFGDKFIGLLNFLPRDEYYKIMDEIDICIMYHNRNQAAGNIFTFLKKGKKLYLKSDAPIALLFNDYGIKYSTDKDLNNEDFSSFKELLTLDAAKRNYEIVEEKLDGEENRLKNFKLILK